MKKANTAEFSENVDDEDNPEWTREQMRSAVLLSGLPADVQRLLRGIQARRAAQKAMPMVQEEQTMVDRCPSESTLKRKCNYGCD
jgi:hypothetical protein